MPEIPEGWSEVEKWVWDRIVLGEPADLNLRGSISKNLVPNIEEGWNEDRCLTAKFFKTILTQKAFVEATPFYGVRILGALIEDIPLNLEFARLQHNFWLEKSRILVALECRNLRVDGQFSLEESFVSGKVEMTESNISEGIFLSGATFEADVNLSGITMDGSAFLGRGATFRGDLHLAGAKIGPQLNMTKSTFEGYVNLNTVTVEGSAFLKSGSTFKRDLDLGGAKIGYHLEMSNSRFEGDVNLNNITVAGAVFLNDGATFKGDLNLGSAKISTNLEMTESIFEGDVNLNSITVNDTVFLRDGSIFKSELDLRSAKISRNLELNKSIFEGGVDLNSTIVKGSALLTDGAIFKSMLNLSSTNIGLGLDMTGSTFENVVDLTGSKVTGVFLIGRSDISTASWADSSALILRNTHVYALQDWWLNDSANAWPKTYQLEGFTYDRLGSISFEKEADMLDRPITSYIKWLEEDRDSSPQPYEHLACRLHEAGEPGEATTVLYAARERRRRNILSRRGKYGRPKKWGDCLRDWFCALGLWLLCRTIGYGLGNRYFRAVWWVLGLSLLGTLILVVATPTNPTIINLSEFFFASLDQLLPIIKLNKAHDALIYGGKGVCAKEYWVQIYFYAHKISGWVLGSFLIAGLSGLTQHN